MASKEVADLAHQAVLTGTEEFHLVAGVIRDGGGAVTNHGNSRYVSLSDIDTYVRAGLGSAAFLASGAFILSSALDVDGTLAANSDVRVASQKAVKTYVDGQVAAGVTRPTVRSTRITAILGTAPPYSFTLPAGTAVGDMLILFVGTGNASSAPTGFTQIDTLQGSFASGSTYAKVMTAGDIAAGTISVPALGGSNRGVMAGVTLIGSTVKGIRKGAYIAARNGTATDGIGAGNVYTYVAPNADPAGLALVFSTYPSTHSTVISFSAGLTSLASLVGAAGASNWSCNVGYANVASLTITLNETATSSAASDGYYNIVLPIS